MAAAPPPRPPAGAPSGARPARAAARPAATRPTTNRAGKGKPRGKQQAGRFRLWLALLPRHWLAVGIIVAVLLVGIPLAHALVGDLGAILLLTGVGGFALGRATAKHDIPGTAALRGKSQPRRRNGGA